MTATAEHRALERLARLDVPRRSTADDAILRPMGRQPGLDGLRALSVLAVIAYHAGFATFSGGFLGVEVFFVVSGYLITTLLIEERARSGRISLAGFWRRRARRLLPALATVLVAVAMWAALWGSAQQQWQLRRDLPWSVFYAANWGQILGDVPYFAGGDPPLLRHLWSLAVEEQWYVVWPLAFVALAALPIGRRARGAVIVGAAAFVMVLTWWLARTPDLDAERTNLLYLSTITRSSGLLLGAGAAFLVRPWERPDDRPPARRRPGMADVAGALALVVLALTVVSAHVDDRATYRWVLPAVSVASLAGVLAAVDPRSRWWRPALSSAPLVAIGRRSYGIYLWSWPITVIAGATGGADTAVRFLVAMGVTAIVAEACFRWIETPIRRDGLRMPRHPAVGTVLGGSVAGLLVVLVVFFGGVTTFDPARGGAEVVFTLPDEAPTPSAPAPTPTVVATAPVATVTVPSVPTATTGPPTTLTRAEAHAAAEADRRGGSAPPTTAAALPRTVVVVGDSQAHSLAVNLPSGIDAYLRIRDGGVDGCGVLSDGQVRSQRRGFGRSLADCAGWEGRWARSAERADAEVALVVLGAWDVFDVEVDGVLIPFGSPESDARFADGVNTGIAALRATGTHVALLEIACMRPQDVDGAGVPALPERGDDTRVAHLNDLLRDIADEHHDVTFVEGPDEWCADEAISTDLSYRWDGVHVHRPGAALVFGTVATDLLSIPLPPRE